MNGLGWIPFPKPISQPDKCKAWMKACGTPKDSFNESKINRSTYICAKHFIGGNGGTTEHPDPIPAVVTEEQVSTKYKNDIL